MNGAELRTRVVERMAEYKARAGEADAGSSIAVATILLRLSTHYRDLVEEIGTRDPDKVCVTQAFTYAANTESMDISVAASVGGTSLFMRRMTRLIQLSGTSRWLLQRLAPAQYERWVGEMSLAALESPGAGKYGWYVEGVNLYLLPKPSSAISLRASVVPLVSDLTTATSPDYLPVNFHNYLATKTALSFLGETRENRVLQLEASEDKRAFERWASSSPNGGTRRVLEV